MLETCFFDQPECTIAFELSEACGKLQEDSNGNPEGRLSPSGWGGVPDSCGQGTGCWFRVPRKLGGMTGHRELLVVEQEKGV